MRHSNPQLGSSEKDADGGLNIKVSAGVERNALLGCFTIDCMDGGQGKNEIKLFCQPEIAICVL